MYGTTLDEALVRHVGEFGWGQLQVLLLASMFLVPNAMTALSWVFMATDPVQAKSWSCAQGPYLAVCEEALASSSPEQAFCSLPAGAWLWMDTRSAATHFDLVCSRKWLSQLANVFFFVGCCIGSAVFGRMCDVVGRKLPLLVATLLVAASVLVSLASTSFWMFVALRVAAGAGAAGQTLSVFLLSTEPAGPSWRGLANIMSLMLFNTGEFVLVLVAYLLPKWQHITLVCGLMNVACLVFWPFIMESPRWLLCKGKQEAATAQVERLCRCNHSHMPPEPLVTQNTTTTTSSQDASSSSKANPGLWDSMRRRPILHRFLVVALLWASAMAAYYGIALGAGDIPGSVYMVFALGAVADVVADSFVAFTADRAGRHITISGGMLLCGAMCVACAVSDSSASKPAFATLGKAGASVALSVTNIYNAELFPTTIRSTIMGLHGLAARLGCIAAPFLLMAGEQAGSSTFGPFLAFGGLSLVSGLLLLTMPETHGAPMPETMEDLDAIQSVFTARPWRQGLWATLAFMGRTSAVHPAALCGPGRDGQQPAGGHQDQELPGWQGPCLTDVEECLGPDDMRAAEAATTKGDGKVTSETAVCRDDKDGRDAGAEAQRDAAGVVSGGEGQGCLVLDVYAGEEGATAIAGCELPPAADSRSSSGANST